MNYYIGAEVVWFVLLLVAKAIDLIGVAIWNPGPNG